MTSDSAGPVLHFLMKKKLGKMLKKAGNNTTLLAYIIGKYKKSTNFTVECLFVL